MEHHTAGTSEYTLHVTHSTLSFLIWSLSQRFYSQNSVSVRHENGNRGYSYVNNASLAHWRFLCFHGQRHARLVGNQTVYDKPKHERTLLVTLLSPLLFFAPEVHLRDVERLWTDDVIIETIWKSFMTKLLGEWEDVILWVMLIHLDQISLTSHDSHSRR